MTIEIDEKTVAMWRVQLGAQGDWLAHMGREPDGTIKILYRHRWYRDSVRGVASKDLRSWYQLTPREADTVEEALRKFRESGFETVKKWPGAQAWELVRGDRTVSEFVQALMQMPGIHVDSSSLN